MGIRFKCHECEYALNVKEFLAGKRGTCPKCGLKFRIPDEDQEYSLVLKPRKKKSKTPAQEPPQEHFETEPAPQQPETHIEAEVPQEPQPVAEQGAEEPEVAPDPDQRQRNRRSPLAEEGVWYVRPPSGGQYGPADNELMASWIEENRVAEGCLVWRDGWPQWRQAEEVFAAELGHPVFDEIDLESDLPSVAGEIASIDTTAPTAAPKAQSPKPEDPGDRKRSRRQKRATMIALLTGVSVLLICVLIVVVAMTGSGAAN